MGVVMREVAMSGVVMRGVMRILEWFLEERFRLE